VVSQARAGREALAQTAASARAVVSLRAGTAAAGTAVVRLVVVVIAQAEKPDEPQD
jgi:hypothetical protein